ncbi:MAG: hypothetical protein N2260_10835 [Syntrophobacterales bacterium]|nr:hypothetical protein [Syntrophobacterales bacterium]
MKVRENTVVLFSYYFTMSPHEATIPPPEKIHTMEVIIGRDMLPIEIELAIMNLDEGEETTIPLSIYNSEAGFKGLKTDFFPFRELPEGIEFKEGMKIPVLKPNGSTEIVIIEKILSEGILGRPLEKIDEEPRWMKIQIKSVRWATLSEFQEGRVISRLRYPYGHHHAH